MNKKYTNQLTWYFKIFLTMEWGEILSAIWWSHIIAKRYIQIFANLVLGTCNITIVHLETAARPSPTQIHFYFPKSSCHLRLRLPNILFNASNTPFTSVYMTIHNPTASNWFQGKFRCPSFIRFFFYKIIPLLWY